MDLNSTFSTKQDLIDASLDSDGFVQQSLLLDEILPLLLETKVVDSEDINHTYYLSSDNKAKINGYTVNGTGERLQIFIVDDDWLLVDAQESTVSQRSAYEEQFKRAERFISNALQGSLSDVQESDPVKPLVSRLSSVDGIESFDVIEFFLVTLTSTVSFKGKSVELRSIHFQDEVKNYSYTNQQGLKSRKEILFIRRVIDLNYLANVIASQGRAEPLVVRFKDVIGNNIKVIKAAEGGDFESYLCVLDANILVDLYKRYSSQLLEKNVRSFLQFKGVNKGIRQTIRDEPEKFIAYNNGLTITATSASCVYHKKELYLESLVDFQIVNGGQTTASIYFSNKEGIDVSKVKVMAKINVAKSTRSDDLEDLISKISEYSNSQSKVSKVDLRSRNKKLIKLKTLSDTVMTPSGKRWFFERAKGDFNTQVRKAPNSNRLKSEFPPERRFTKELMAKYYCAWGDAPYMVKKGGEKVFRTFIENLDPEVGPDVEVDRSFYEELVARIIIFRTMEKIYGQGKGAIGQLRSAAVPYAMSAIFNWNISNNNRFSLQRVWREEQIGEQQKEYFKSLLQLINDLIKRYSLSDDFGEYSKKQELWESIKSSQELKDFMSNAYTSKMLDFS